MRYPWTVRAAGLSLLAGLSACGHAPVKEPPSTEAILKDISAPVVAMHGVCLPLMAKGRLFNMLIAEQWSPQEKRDKLFQGYYEYFLQNKNYERDAAAAEARGPECAEDVKRTREYIASNRRTIDWAGTYFPVESRIKDVEESVANGKRRVVITLNDGTTRVEETAL